jgi:general L-amino acid transport system substrate-binding protein
MLLPVLRCTDFWRLEVNRLVLSLIALCCLPLAAHAAMVPSAPPPFTPVHYKADTLKAIEAAHKLRCGVVTEAEDYSPFSTHGDLSGFGADLCRAIAAALLGNRDALTLNGYPDDAHGLRGLHEGEVDLLFGVTPDAASALPYNVMFGPTAFFDGQGFLVSRKSGITSPGQLSHKLLCFITGTSQEARMNDWGAASGVAFWAHDFQERGEMDTALETGNCAAITDDVTALAQMRAGLSRPSREFAILPQMIAIDPWAPAMRAGDVRLNAVVTDVMAALIKGEELGITAATANAPHKGADMLLGSTPGIAATLGMPDGWARRAIAARGNYGEMFDRDLGAQAPFLLERGPDALWDKGGMLAAPTVR